MAESSILIVHLRECIPEERLRADLLALLGLQPGQLGPLEEVTEGTVVPYQYTARARGFRTTIELYVGRAPPAVPQSDLSLARILANHYGQDALIPPPGGEQSPYHWVLVRPSGDTVNVREAPPDDEEDGIVIDEPEAHDAAGAPWRKLHFETGQEHTPTHSLGQTILELDAHGNIRLDNRVRGVHRAWRALCLVDVLWRIHSHLREAAFPSVPEHVWRPGSMIRVLTVESDSGIQTARIEFNTARRLTGYAHAFELLDAIVAQASAGAVTFAPSQVPQLVTDVQPLT